MRWITTLLILLIVCPLFAEDFTLKEFQDRVERMDYETLVDLGRTYAQQMNDLWNGPTPYSQSDRKALMFLITDKIICIGVIKKELEYREKHPNLRREVRW